MGRLKQATKRQLLLRLPEDLYAEVLLLNPQMQDETGYLRYGAISQYFTSLVQRDLEIRRSQLRAEYNNAAH